MRSGASSTTDGQTRESGYVIATTALLLVPLMIFAAFAVDVGGWYAEADKAQRAADAAALAGVIHMPSLPDATREARLVAAANGFDHDNDPDVNVIVEERGSQGINVNIETKGETHFGQVVLDDIDINRFASAQYVVPVPLGNPGSSIGAGLNPPINGDPNERMLLALNSYCFGYDNGDQIGAGFMGGTQSGGACGTTPNTTTYDEQGYEFVLDFTGDVANSAPVRGQWELQIFEPGLCGQLLEYDDGPRLRTTLWRGDETLINDADNRVAAKAVTAIPSISGAVPSTPAMDTGEYAWPRDECGGSDTSTENLVPPRSPWVPAYRIDADTNQGRWLLRTRTSRDTSERFMNAFGLRIVDPVSGVPCGQIAISSTCPQIYARSWLSIFIPKTIRQPDNVVESTFAGSRSAIFYLADISRVHAGKTLEVRLFDPGEGMNNMQIIAPNGERIPFEIATRGAGADEESAFVSNTNNCTASDITQVDAITLIGSTHTCLDVTGDVFNGVEVVIRIEIPDETSYDCPALAGVENCWWRVRYEANSGSGDITDRTTWAIKVIGDPIRLTE